MMQDKPVVTSSLTLRFYKKDGWREECLRKYVCGPISDSELVFGDTPESAYFTLDLGSSLDLASLYLNEISTVVRTFDDYPGDDDFAFLNRFL